MPGSIFETIRRALFITTRGGYGIFQFADFCLRAFWSTYLHYEERGVQLPPISRILFAVCPTKFSIIESGFFGLSVACTVYLQWLTNVLWSFVEQQHKIRPLTKTRKYDDSVFEQRVLPSQMSRGRGKYRGLMPSRIRVSPR
jgi:hypothetical protein